MPHDTRHPDTFSGVATNLMTAMTRLRARLRVESVPSDMVSWSQLTTLGRLAEDGPSTTTELARAEHVRRQSMAETVGALRESGLVEAAPDPNDRRAVLISATPHGREVWASIPVARVAWFTGAIEHVLSADEVDVLARAAAVMLRLADAQVETPSPRQQRAIIEGHAASGKRPSADPYA